MFAKVDSLLSWGRKLIQRGNSVRPPQRRAMIFKPWAEKFEDRLAPADLGMGPPLTLHTAWPTFGHDDLRTAASTVSSLVTVPTILWLNPQMGTGGTPTVGNIGVGTGGITPIYSPATGTVYEFNDATGASVTQVSGGPQTFSLNSVLSDPTVDSAGNVYVTTTQFTVQKISPAGATQWSYRPTLSTIITTDPFVPSLTGGYLPDVYFGGAQVPGVDGTVYEVTDGGTAGWSTPVVGTPISVSSSPDGLTLYVMTTVDTGYPSHGSHIFSINATTGAINWQASAGSQAGVGRDAIVVNANLGLKQAIGPCSRYCFLRGSRSASFPGPPEEVTWGRSDGVWQRLFLSAA